MLYLLCFLLFFCWYLLGCIIMLFVSAWFVKDKFENYLDNFENRIDYSFERYFKFPLFDKKD